MLCHNCGAENPQGRRFCEECGERLATVEHRREKDRTKARRAAAKARMESEGLTPAERRRQELRARRPSVKIKPRRALAMLAAVILIAILIVVLVLAFSGSASAPAKAVQGFLNSLEKRDVVAYVRYTDPVIYAEVQKQGLQLNPDDYFPPYTYHISGLKLQTANSAADTAVVNITGGVMEANMVGTAFSTQTLDFAQHPRVAQLAKVDGTWIITNYAELQLPYELPTQVTPEQGALDEGI